MTTPAPAATSDRVEGHVAVHPRGFGFLSLEAGAPVDTAFITPPALNPFLHGDLVSARLAPEGEGRFRAEDLRLVSRRRTQVFGTLVERRGKRFLQIDRRVANTDWPVAGGVELPIGASVVADIAGSAVVVREAAHDESLDRVLVRYGISLHYSDEALEQLAKLPPLTLEGRRDLRELTTLTIDAEHSRDLDDALSALPAAADGGLRVFVHIADVDAYVTAGSPLDLEARRRGTSVYLADKVVPMLPHELSEDRLSILPGQDRPALTAELRLDPDGVVTAIDLYPSLIRSDVRLSYRQVARFLERGENDAVPEVVQDTLRWLRAAAARLGVVRAARGGIRIAREEAKIILDETSGEPTKIDHRADDSSHALIERLMVAANEAIARWLVERGLPGVFRVHPEPDPARVEALVDSARRLGFEAGLVTPLSPRALAAFELQFRGTHAEPAMDHVLSRVLGPARYTVHPSPHFGLAASLYLHFTSPIRRYADLAVHRIVKAYLGGRRDLVAGDPALETLALGLNDLAAQAEKAERERFEMLAARYYGTRVGERHRGTIVGVKTFGLVVQLAPAVTGSIAMEDLAGGPFEVDRTSQRLMGKARSYHTGEPIEVEVAAVQEALGRIELRPV